MQKGKGNSPTQFFFRNKLLDRSLMNETPLSLPLHHYYPTPFPIFQIQPPSLLHDDDSPITHPYICRPQTLRLTGGKHELTGTNGRVNTRRLPLNDSAVSPNPPYYRPIIRDTCAVLPLITKCSLTHLCKYLKTLLDDIAKVFSLF